MIMDKRPKWDKGRSNKIPFLSCLLPTGSFCFMENNLIAKFMAHIPKNNLITVCCFFGGGKQVEIVVCVDP